MAAVTQEVAHFLAQRLAPLEAELDDGRRRGLEERVGVHLRHDLREWRAEAGVDRRGEEQGVRLEVEVNGAADILLFYAEFPRPGRRSGWSCGARSLPGRSALSAPDGEGDRYLRPVAEGREELLGGADDVLWRDPCHAAVIDGAGP